MHERDDYGEPVPNHAHDPHNPPPPSRSKSPSYSYVKVLYLKSKLIIHINLFLNILQYFVYLLINYIFLHFKTNKKILKRIYYYFLKKLFYFYFFKEQVNLFKKYKLFI